MMVYNDWEVMSLNPTSGTYVIKKESGLSG